MTDQIIYCGTPRRLRLRNNWLLLSDGLTPGSIEQAAHRVCWDDIGFIELDHPEITLSFSVMQRAADLGIPLLVSDSKHMPTGLLLPLQGHTTQTKSIGAQLAAKLTLKKRLWQQCVQAKLLNHARLAENQDAMDIGKRLRQLASKVKSGDPENKEAVGARAYWRLFDHFADSDRTDGIPTDDIKEKSGDGFVRFAEGRWPNNLLNYAYAILRAMMARALVASGLLPQLGLFHHNQYDHFPLANDLMEPYRAVADQLVLHVAPNHEPTENLSTQYKADLLLLPTISVQLDGQRVSVANAIRRTTASLARCYLGEQNTIDFPTLCT